MASRSHNSLQSHTTVPFCWASQPGKNRKQEKKCKNKETSNMRVMGVGGIALLHSFSCFSYNLSYTSGPTVPCIIWDYTSKHLTPCDNACSKMATYPGNGKNWPTWVRVKHRFIVEMLKSGVRWPAGRGQNIWQTNPTPGSSRGRCPTHTMRFKLRCVNTCCL